MNEHEQALAALVRFFEYREAFDLNRLYKEVNLEWIPFALERLQTYLYEDMYLAKAQKPLIIREPSDIETTTLVDLVQRTKTLMKGLPYGERKIFGTRVYNEFC